MSARNEENEKKRKTQDRSDEGDTTSSGTSGTTPSPESSAEAVEPGMVVEAREGDLGERDVSTARVKDVERDASGDVTGIVVEKGVVFRKKLEVPADRIASVEPEASPDGPKNADRPEGRGNDTARKNAAPVEESQLSGNGNGNGKVVLDTTRQEIRDLSATGSEALSPEEPPPVRPDTSRNAAEQITDGASSRKRRRKRSAAKTGFSLRNLGPGMLAGMAGNDSSAVTSYSINGATNGYGQLWLLLLATPLYQAVQYACAKIGRITQQGFAEVLRQHYGRKVAVPASLILVVANTALIAADLVAIGTGIQLITGIAWEWFVVPVAAGIWYLAVFKSFGVIKKIFLGMSLAFVAYLITGVFSGANWGLVLQSTVVPHLQFNMASISSAVALLGATVSPYTMYWQVQGEKEQKRPGGRKQQFRLAAMDIVTGTISGNLVAYAIIVCTSATLFTHHKSVRTAADAAAALAPLLGNYAEYLFAIGFIGAGLIAIPVLLASTSYGLSGLFGWTASLWTKPWQSEGFYLVMSGALIVSLALALLGFDPIQLMFGANVLQGTLSPVLVVFLILVGNNRKIMRSHGLGRFTNIGLVAIALVMSAATVLLFYGLLTGRGA